MSQRAAIRGRTLRGRIGFFSAYDPIGKEEHRMIRDPYDAFDALIFLIGFCTLLVLSLRGWWIQRATKRNSESQGKKTD
jgi:hypothetical protein